MTTTRTLTLGVLALVCLALASPRARAGFSFSVTLDTSPLVGDPYYVEFALTGGPTTSGTFANSVTISNFQFGGGSAIVDNTLTPFASPSALIGTPIGDMGSTVTLSDAADFTTIFRQAFNHGSQLSFSISSTTNVNTVNNVPDGFGFGLLDGSGNAIPTQEPNFTYALITFSIDSPAPTVNSFGTTPDSPVQLSPPVVTPALSAVPAPPSLVLAGIGSLTGLLIYWSRRTKEPALVGAAR